MTKSSSNDRILGSNKASFNPTPLNPTRHSKTMKTLVVCDVQPDGVQKLPQPRQFVDLVHLAVHAARLQRQRQGDEVGNQMVIQRILFTQLHFDQPGYEQIPSSHPRLGILRKLAGKVSWFTSSALSLPVEESDAEQVITRTTFLPQANDDKLLQALRECLDPSDNGEGNGKGNGDDQAEFTVIGYGPVVQSVCNILGDVLAVSNVRVVRECVRDETEERCQALLNHGLLFKEQVISLEDFLEERNQLQEEIPRIETVANRDETIECTPPSPVKYVTDCGRGGHLSLFLPYLIRNHGYCEWPTQTWYKELSFSGSKDYLCPMGKQRVHLCDEPKFGFWPSFFILGRQYLDEKDELFKLVPELMPPTFHSLQEAQTFEQEQQTKGATDQPNIWFLKKVNQNGGRAIQVLSSLPTNELEADDQLQLHVPRPLLYSDNGRGKSGKFKCHVKTYQYIACCSSSATGGESLNNKAGGVEWQLYMHDLFYLATADQPWKRKSSDGTSEGDVVDLSDASQITTFRSHRLGPEHPWRVQWNLTEIIRAHMTMIMQRAVDLDKLQVREQHLQEDEQATQSKQGMKTMQFEINSADWMLDENGKVYLIEINGIPVLYDAGGNQELCTKGLKIYDELFKQNPKTAVVNDHDLLKEALGLALKGKLPKTSLWKHVATFPAKATSEEKKEES